MRKTRMTMMGFLVAAAVAAFFGAGVVSAETAQPAVALDTQPGPAFQTVDGELKKIDGHTYVIEESVVNYRGEKVGIAEVRFYVGKETKRVRGEKKVGDTVRAEITRGGFANSIQ
jgi:hypothetical protein